MNRETSAGTLRPGARPMRTLARVNRVVTNPIQLMYADKVPGMGVIEHAGRVSGKKYRTPVLARLHLGRGQVPLPYGSATDWIKNLLENGGAIVARGKRYDVSDVRVVRGKVDHLEFAIHLRHDGDRPAGDGQ